MMTDYADHHYRNSHKPPRAIVFFMGIALGALAGSVLTFTYAGLLTEGYGAAPVSAWKDKQLICVSATPTKDGRIFYVQNRSDRDYGLKAETRLVMKATAQGYLPTTDYSLPDAIVIPLGVVVGIPVVFREPGASTSLVVFDMARRIRIDLNK